MADLLRGRDARVVTLTGTGGTGKTRLAIQVAAGLLDDFADGVLFVGLAPLQDPDLVLPTVAETLGVRATSGETSREALARRLRTGELLLVLDNFEHVARGRTAVAASPSTAPTVKLLVTSRAPLRPRAERVYPGLPAGNARERTDDVERLSQCESVALFESRAQIGPAGFRGHGANAQRSPTICRALDGLPLAIELAATRVGVAAAGGSAASGSITL